MTSQRIEDLLRQGRDAESRLDWEHAVHAYSQIIDTASAEPDTLFEALYAVGRCENRKGGSRAAWRALNRATSLAREAGRPLLLGRAALALATVNAPFSRQAPILDEALDAVGEQDPVLWARLAARRVAFDRTPEGRDLAARAQAIAERHEVADVDAMLRVRSIRTSREPSVTDLAAAEMAAHRALAEAAFPVPAALRVRASGQVLLYSGLMDDAERRLDEAVRFTREHGLGHEELRNLSFLGALALARCDLARLDEINERLVEGADLVSSTLPMARAEIVGDLDGALALLPDPASAGRVPAFMAYLHGGRARVLHHAGDDDAAREELRWWGEAIATQRGTVSEAGLSEVDTTVAILGEAQLVESVYAELASRDWQRFGGRGFDLMRGALALRLGRIEDARHHFHTGRAWALGEGLRVDAARCLAGLADVSAAERDHDQALALLHEAAAELRGTCARVYTSEVEARLRAVSAVRHLRDARGGAERSG